ncbi:formylglycine-generating enzyme family protein [Dulcicalothrix desertica]|uniref:formylglycine-generating enzyme family protein n=1 Tax=Dulcicalothrix desertica TaxID=32056 RepID=UPI002279DDD4|nr:SUMF1/EgtB/PvdO family nonheme iron enzyme [Dulcicalothrix desertica]
MFYHCEAPTDASIWKSGNNERNVMRGGSWFYNPQLCRSAFRYSNDLNNFLDDIGFRVVCDVAVRNSQAPNSKLD